MATFQQSPRTACDATTPDRRRIEALEREVRDLILDAALLRDDLKRQIHGAYPGVRQDARVQTNG